MDRQEAIKIVERNWPDGRSALQEALGVLIPELNEPKESEDERVRKKCIELIKRVIPSGNNQSSESKDILDCISYLEKQKEPFIIHDTGCSKMGKMPEYCLNVKPVEWSEEDEAMLENILGTYKTLEDMLNLSTGQDRDILENMNFERDWLKNKFKSLRPQPQAIWQTGPIMNLGLDLQQGKKFLISSLIGSPARSRLMR